MTTGTETQTVSRETMALLPSEVEGTHTAPAEEAARDTVLCWGPNTTNSYLVGWNDFTRWCFQNRCPALPSDPADVGRYLEDLVETRGKALTTARNRLAAIAAAHRLDKHRDPLKDSLVKATLKRLAREYGKPRKQAKVLTSDALATVKATARTHRVH